MKKTLILTGIIVCVASLLTIACNADSTATTEVAEASFDTAGNNLVQRGEYLVKIMDCNECHSPKVMGEFGPAPDPNRLLSGHPSNLPFPKIDTADLRSFVLFNQISTAAAGPWGISFSANLTSDESGIGNWTEQQFVTAIRTGKSKGLENGRPILPPMPWRNYASNLKDDDLKAIFAYLKTTKPVENVVPAPINLSHIK